MVYEMILARGGVPVGSISSRVNPGLFNGGGRAHFLNRAAVISSLDLPGPGVYFMERIGKIDN